MPWDFWNTMTLMFHKASLKLRWLQRGCLMLESSMRPRKIISEKYISLSVTVFWSLVFKFFSVKIFLGIFWMLTYFIFWGDTCCSFVCFMFFIQQKVNPSKWSSCLHAGEPLLCCLPWSNGCLQKVHRISCAALCGNISRVTISPMLDFAYSDLLSCKLLVSSNTVGWPWPR